MFLHWPWARIELYRLWTLAGIWRAKAGEAATAANKRVLKLRILTERMLYAVGTRGEEKLHGFNGGGTEALYKPASIEAFLGQSCSGAIGLAMFRPCLYEHAKDPDSMPENTPNPVARVSSQQVM